MFSQLQLTFFEDPGMQVTEVGIEGHTEWWGAYNFNERGKRLSQHIYQWQKGGS